MEQKAAGGTERSRDMEKGIKKRKREEQRQGERNGNRKREEQKQGERNGKRKREKKRTGSRKGNET